MPELPDVTVYVECLREKLVGHVLRGIRFQSPFLLRSVTPPISTAHGRVVVGVDRLGKRLVFGLEGERFLVLHLMVAGRLAWKEPGAKGSGKVTLCLFDFEPGTLVLTEASTKKRASLHLVEGRAALAEHDRGGLEVLTATRAEFEEALLRENHTLKRSLTDPRLFSGIGNAYSDEILHQAGLSPLRLTQKLDPDERARLFQATRDTLETWTRRLREEARRTGFPEKVTAFRPEMAVHGKYGQPCPRCGGKVQRIVYAENETNYCPRCQNEGRLLADRSLSRLLHDDWPRSLEELEERRTEARSKVAPSSSPSPSPESPSPEATSGRRRPKRGA